MPLVVRRLERDARMLAISLARSPSSWYLALAALGHSPGTVRVDKVLEQLRSHAALRSVESVTRGAPGDETRAAAFVGVQRGAIELQQMVVPSDAALRKGLNSIRLVTDPARIPSIHALSNGMHTVEVAPQVDPPECDAS